MKIKKYNDFINENVQENVQESKLFTTKEEIVDWFNRADIALSKYRINDDLTVDSNWTLTFPHNYLKDILPVIFNRVNGWFNININGLTTLKGCPKYVGGGFNCSYNYITTLEGCPNIVEGEFYCNKNHDLTSLKGLNKKFDLNMLGCDNQDLIWKWLESNLTEDESLITYNINWINKFKDEMPNRFNEKFGYLLEFEHYTKTLKN